MVLPPASSAPRCASASIPCARPLVTTTPRDASSAASRRAMRAPAGVARRLPTTATWGADSTPGSPRTNSTAGASGIAPSRSGISGSRAPMTCAPRAWRHARSRSARCPGRSGERGGAVLRATLGAGRVLRLPSRAVARVRASASRVRSRSMRCASMRCPVLLAGSGGGIIPPDRAGIDRPPPTPPDARNVRRSARKLPDRVRSSG